MSKTAKCNYCNKEVAPQMQVRHETVCLQGPAGESLKAFLRKHAYGDLTMQKQEYMRSRERKTLGLVDGTTLVRWFGSWDNVAQWCGLRYKRYTTKAFNDEMNHPAIHEGYKAYYLAMEEAYDFRSIPAIDRGERAVFDWRTMSYRLCHVMELR